MGLKSVEVKGGDDDEWLQLKSDQNGIEMIRVYLLHIITYRLKSDQNGIEIIYRCKIRCEFTRLKSDQNGIEITTFNPHDSCHSC